MNKNKVVFGIIFGLVLMGAVTRCAGPRKSSVEFIETTLNVNQTADAKLNAGEPLIAEFSVFLTSPSENQKMKPVEIRSKRGWDEKVRFVVKNKSDESQTWPWKLSTVTKRIPKIKLQKQKMFLLIWAISPEDSLKILPGVYTLQSELIVNKKTKVLSRPVRIEIGERNKNGAVNEIETAVHRARYLLYQGEKEKALAVIESSLQNHPENPYLYEYKGDLLVIQDQTKEAMDSYMKAINLNKNPHDQSALMKYQKLWEKSSLKK